MDVDVTRNLVPQLAKSLSIDGVKNVEKFVKLLSLPNVYSTLIFIQENGALQLSGMMSLIKYNKDCGYLRFHYCKPSVFDGYFKVVSRAETPSDELLVAHPRAQNGHAHQNGHSNGDASAPEASIVVLVAKTTDRPPPIQRLGEVHIPRASKRVLEHLFDECAASAFGVLNLEKERCISVDLDKESAEWHLYRDTLGFLVADSAKIQQCLIDCARVSARYAARALPSTKIDVQRADASNFDALAAYEAAILKEAPTSCLKYLIEDCKSDAILAVGVASQRCEGLCVFDGERISALYADSTLVAQLLLKAACAQLGSATVVANLLCGSFFEREISDSGAAKKLKEVRRLHTTYMPSFVQWASVYIVNAEQFIV